MSSTRFSDHGGNRRGGESFDRGGAWADIEGRFRKLGGRLLEKVLIAWYVATDPKTPAWARATLGGALVYFGIPLDAVPDAVPVAGFSDDLAVLAAALAAVATAVRVSHIRRARATMRIWGIDIDDDPECPDDDPTAA
jgi:uncharacterized membrane protein YkvA (DUF1232 family)